MVKIVADINLIPTTIKSADGTRYHPGIEQGLRVYYFDHISFATDNEAMEWAGLSIKDAWDAANAVVGQWNIAKL